MPQPNHRSRRSRYAARVHELQTRRPYHYWAEQRTPQPSTLEQRPVADPTESEQRAAWGDR